MMMLVPADALAGPERIQQLVDVVRDGDRRQEKSRQIDRTVFIGQCESLLGRERILPRPGIVANITARCLGIQPLADVAFRRSRLLCDFGGGHRLSAAHRLVQTKTIAKRDQRCVDGRSHIYDGLVHEVIQFCFVERCLRSLSCHANSSKKNFGDRNSCLELLGTRPHDGVAGIDWRDDTPKMSASRGKMTPLPLRCGSDNSTERQKGRMVGTALYVWNL